MQGRKPKYASMRGIRHGICKANSVDYTTPTKTKHEMASPTKIRVIPWQNYPKNPLKRYLTSLGMKAYAMIMFKA